MRVKQSDLLKLFPTLDRAKVATLIRSVLDTANDPEADLDDGEVLTAGIWEFLLALGFMSDAQAAELLKEMTLEVTAFAQQGIEKLRQTLRVFHLTLAESRWAVWPGRTRWFDVVYYQWVHELPEPAVLLIVCDVSALFLRINNRAAALEGSKDATDRGPTGASAS